MVIKSPLFFYILLFVAAIAIYGKLLSPNFTFGGMDFANLGYPRSNLAKEIVLQGEIPLWNAKEWGGVPLLATMLGAVAYPFTWLTWLLPLPWGLQLFVFVHLLLGGTGVFLCCKKIWNLTDIAALFAATAYLGSAFFIGRLEQFQVLACNIWLPWLTLALTSVLRGENGHLKLTVVTAMMLLAGHPQFAFFNFCGAFAVAFLSPTGRTGESGFPFRRVAKNFAVGLFFLGLGFLAAMPQLMPTQELAALSERVYPYPDPFSPSLEWRHLPALFVPHYYNLLSGETGGRILGYTEQGLYLGVLTVVFALAAVGFSFKNRVKTPLILVILWAGTILFALGKQGGIAPTVLDIVGFLERSRGTARILNVSSFLLAAIAGHGVNGIYLFLREKKSRRYADWVFAALFLILTADLAFTHHKEIQAHLVPADVLNLRQPANPSADVVSPRTYRFMHFDSDFYLDNSPRGVRERLARLQPNNLLPVALNDGYEEGLLPTREYANFLRRFNRNLRSESPDAALLALTRSASMLTEYPLATDSPHWRTPVKSDMRPSFVPAFDSPATYTNYKNPFEAGAFLSSPELDTVWNSPQAAAYNTDSFAPIPPGQIALKHPMQSVAPKVWNNAVLIPKADSTFSPNTLAFRSDKNTTGAIYWTQAYFPGWQAVQPAEARVEKLNSLITKIDLPAHFATSGGIAFKLVYRPFSFRLGLFLALCSVAVGIMIFSIKRKNNSPRS